MHTYIRQKNYDHSNFNQKLFYILFSTGKHIYCITNLFDYRFEDFCLCNVYEYIYVLL